MKPKTKLLFPSLLIAILLVVFSAPLWGHTDPYYRLRYAQVADGVFGTTTYATTIVVSNPNHFGVDVKLEDFAHNNPMSPLNTSYTHSCPTVEATTTFITVHVYANSSCRLDTAWTGPGETGWLRVTEVTMTYDIGGYLCYTLYQGYGTAGAPIFTVGISPTQIVNDFHVPVLRDVGNAEDTAYAMTNPWASNSISMYADLYDKFGTHLTWTTITLAPWGHRAQFFSELFPAQLQNASNFVGTVFFTGLTSLDSANAAVLISRRGQIGGATPTLDTIDTMKAPPHPEAEVFHRPETGGPVKDAGLRAPGIL